jgi:hypothetical protein
MKWKIKEPPKLGDWRHRTKFAWFPTTIHDHKVWLETYGVKEHYIEVVCYNGAILPYPIMEWVEYDRHILYSV